MYQEIFSLTTPANPASLLDNAVDKVSSLLLLIASLISWTARNTVIKIEQKIIKKTVTCCLNSSPTDWLENCRCLNGWPGAWGLQGMEVSMATPCMGTSPVSSCRLALSHWTRAVGKYSPKRFETSEGKGGLGAWFACIPTNWTAIASSNPQKFTKNTC